jgi:hypothetical protein
VRAGTEFPSSAFDSAVVPYTEKRQILYVGVSAECPGLDVVDFAPVCGHFAAVDGAVHIAQRHDIS